MATSTVLLFCTVWFCCDAYKLLLVFPVPSRSHSILGEGYVKHLARAGHDITYVTPLPMKTPPAGVRQIDVSDNKQHMPVDLIFDTRPLINQEVDLQDLEMIKSLCLIFANATIHIENVQKLLRDPNEQFDAVIVEWFYTEMLSGFASVFNCPLIWSSSMDPHSMVLSLIDDYPNPAYTTPHVSRHYGSSFWHRMHQLWMMSRELLVNWNMKHYENQVFIDTFEKFVKNRDRALPPYDDVRYNGSLLLGNSYISTGEPVSLPPNYKPVGGYHIDKEQDPLPKNLKKIMDDAKNGVIYFSMGSLLRSSRIPEHVKAETMKIFEALDQTVIWKFEDKLLNVPRNVHILPWAPQTGILAHPNCILFITHGGILSQLEALQFGVPMISIPQYGDQFLNTNRGESKGFLKGVDFYGGAKKLELAIHQILNNSSYRERAKEYSFIQQHRPAPPERELVHWVEHVIETRGAPHLRSKASRMPWYQKNYLDLFAVILFTVYVIVKLSKHAAIRGKMYFKDKKQ